MANTREKQIRNIMIEKIAFIVIIVIALALFFGGVSHFMKQFGLIQAKLDQNNIIIDGVNTQLEELKLIKITE